MPTSQNLSCQKYQKNIKLGLGITIISSFIKLTWEQHHQLAFVIIIRYVIHSCLQQIIHNYLQQIIKALGFLNVWSCDRLPYKKFPLHCLRYFPPDDNVDIKSEISDDNYTNTAAS